MADPWGGTDRWPGCPVNARAVFNGWLERFIRTKHYRIMHPSTQTEIHILNVGHGDCAIIKHASGLITMIDINNGQTYDPDTERELAEAKMIRRSVLTERQLFANRIGSHFSAQQAAPGGYAAELTDPVAYFTNHFPGQSIFRFILTHPDLDHLRGLSRLVNSGVQIEHFWDTGNTIRKTDFQSDDDKADWSLYQSIRSGQTTTNVLKLLREQSGKYWNEDDYGGYGDGWNILAPTTALRDAANAADDPNAHSYVLHLRINGFVVVFGGDATKPVLADIANTYGRQLKASIYKAAHHGRESGYSLEAMQVMSPEYTLVSVGKKPDTDASNKYRPLSSKGVWSTRHRGDIVIRVDTAGNYELEDDDMREARIARQVLRLGGYPIRRAA